MTTQYLESLAYELRRRKNNEDMVAATLKEVRSHIASSGERGEEAFGEPRDYAASFPAGTYVSNGRRVGQVAAGVIIAMLAVYLLLRGVAGVQFGVPGTLAYFGAVVVLAAALIVTGERMDRRLPHLG